jgi:HPt (histidine-containing phosphotransfer) domain-containing protein
MADPAIIDPQAIENLRALNPDDGEAFLREIAGIYLEDTPVRLRELDESLATGDTGKFTRAAHSIKGSSSNVGANTVKAVAEKLEQQSRDTGLTDVTKLLSDLKAEYTRASAELCRIIGQ